jgi:hypothetical protein
MSSKEVADLVHFILLLNAVISSNRGVPQFTKAIRSIETVRKVKIRKSEMKSALLYM